MLIFLAFACSLFGNLKLRKFKSVLHIQATHMLRCKGDTGIIMCFFVAVVVVENHKRNL